MGYRLSRTILGHALILFVLAVEGKGPYLMLASTRPKCVTVAARGTLLIEYEVPDMVIVPDEDSVGIEKGLDGGDVAMGLDARYEKRLQDKMEAMRRAGRDMRDMSIVIQPKGETIRDIREGFGNRERGAMQNRLFGLGSTRMRRELEEKQGVIEYDTGDRAGEVEICIQSLNASKQNPSRFFIKVDQLVSKPKADKSNDASVVASQKKATEQMTRMERDLVGLNQKLEVILTNADHAKENQVTFHDQSLAMHRASQWWPILHLVVLLVTGTIQANYIVRFFKSRHIV